MIKSTRMSMAVLRTMSDDKTPLRTAIRKQRAFQLTLSAWRLRLRAPQYLSPLIGRSLGRSVLHTGVLIGLRWWVVRLSRRAVMGRSRCLGRSALCAPLFLDVLRLWFHRNLLGFLEPYWGAASAAQLSPRKIGIATLSVCRAPVPPDSQACPTRASVQLAANDGSFTIGNIHGALGAGQGSPGAR